MNIKKKILSGIVSCAVIVTLSNSASPMFAADNVQEKDYTTAPYYNALMEWFDFFDYTDEQRADFMKDTETLDHMLYSDEYWNYGNYSFNDLSGDNGISAQSILCPVSGHEPGTYFSNPIRGVGCPPCEHHNSGCSYDGSCGCRSEKDHIQCIGFAWFLRWVYTGSYFGSSCRIGGLSAANWTTSKIKDYFTTNKANVGSHVRLHVRNRNYDHSYTVVGVSSTGIKVYDANWDGHCGIRIADVTWTQIYSFFDYIDYTDKYYG